MYHYLQIISFLFETIYNFGRGHRIYNQISIEFQVFCVFVLRLNVQINTLAVMSGRSNYQYFRGVTCLAQGHNTAEVAIEPTTSRFGVRRSITEPPHSPNFRFEIHVRTSIAEVSSVSSG